MFSSLESGDLSKESFERMIAELRDYKGPTIRDLKMQTLARTRDRLFFFSHHYKDLINSLPKNDPLIQILKNDNKVVKKLSKELDQ